MTWLISAAIVAAWFALVIIGWRLGYMWGYEGKTHRGMGYSFQTAEQVARERGILCALLAPVMVPALLIGKFATPMPPSKAEELRRDNARRLEALERELGIGGF